MFDNQLRRLTREERRNLVSEMISVFLTSPSINATRLTLVSDGLLIELWTELWKYAPKVERWYLLYAWIEQHWKWTVSHSNRKSGFGAFFHQRSVKLLSSLPDDSVPVFVVRELFRFGLLQDSFVPSWTHYGPEFTTCLDYVTNARDETTLFSLMEHLVELEEISNAIPGRDHNFTRGEWIQLLGKWTHRYPTPVEESVSWKIKCLIVKEIRKRPEARPGSSLWNWEKVSWEMLKNRQCPREALSAFWTEMFGIHPEWLASLCWWLVQYADDSWIEKYRVLLRQNWSGGHINEALIKLIERASVPIGCVELLLADPRCDPAYRNNKPLKLALVCGEKRVVSLLEKRLDTSPANIPALRDRLNESDATNPTALGRKRIREK
jgi:hypothetical protein